jgi:hypothetical protein
MSDSGLMETAGKKPRKEALMKEALWLALTAWLVMAFIGATQMIARGEWSWILIATVPTGTALVAFLFFSSKHLLRKKSDGHAGGHHHGHPQ